MNVSVLFVLFYGCKQNKIEICLDALCFVVFF